MVAVFQSPISAEEVKAQAISLGADLVGVADAQAMNDHPPFADDPKRPSDISDYDADRVIVLARRINLGTSRITKWEERHKYYNVDTSSSISKKTFRNL